MKWLQAHLRLMRQRQVVRPWALAVPILVLAFALPLLRPLRHPVDVSREESLRLTTITALAQNGALSLPEVVLAPDERVEIEGNYYANQPPALALLLAGPYWAMQQMGWSLENDSALVNYLLTVIGVTLPVALGVGLVYRMGRLFELSRPMRMLLALLVAFGSGLVSYATVLNAHAPAGVLVIASATLLLQAAIQGSVTWGIFWLLPCGMIVALAAFMEPPAWVFVVLFLFVVLAIRWKVPLRLMGAAVYLLGAGIVVLGHVLVVGGELTYATTVPAPIQALHADLMQTRLPAPEVSALELDVLDEGTGRGSALHDAGRVLMTLIGNHGLLSHFPVVILAMVGIGAVMHRHWPASTKVFAMATVGGSLAILIGCVLWSTDRRPTAFATPWFVVFTPLLIFWVGAWLRRSHRPRSWVLAGLLIGFSVIITMIGATRPLPRDGYNGYSALAVVRELVQSAAVEPASALAGAK